MNSADSSAWGYWENQDRDLISVAAQKTDEISVPVVLDPDNSPRHIGEARRYLRGFVASLASTSTAMELYETMLSLHPDRVNPGSLWAAAKASKQS